MQQGFDNKHIRDSVIMFVMSIPPDMSTKQADTFIFDNTVCDWDVVRNEESNKRGQIVL